MSKLRKRRLKVLKKARELMRSDPRTMFRGGLCYYIACAAVDLDWALAVKQQKNTFEVYVYQDASYKLTDDINFSIHPHPYVTDWLSAQGILFDDLTVENRYAYRLRWLDWIIEGYEK